MSHVEKITKHALPSELTSAQSSPTRNEVPQMIQLALERHRRDLPGLMRRHAKHWVAYRGDERLEFGKSKRALYHKYLDRGLTLDELVVLGVESDLPDELDPAEWADV